MGRRSRWLIIVASALLSVAPGSTTPAFAETVILLDTAGDNGAATDLLRLRVAHGEPSAPNRLKLKAAHDGIENFEGYVRFWIDTEKGNTGPEYVSDVVANSGGIALMRVGGWRDRDKQKVSCPGLRARADAFVPDPIVLSVPRTCLGMPHRARGAAVSSAPAPDGTVDRDWVGSRRQWTTWADR
jgi:hypothetical protein